uniref:Uncharacterized protein n=1 Tax=Clandestinovirus TaxID=2831644 RepID=A0A8F8KLC5_9VIRU|nr:hypothetical protein KOM_12_210 [Clandestinovirus]
MDRIAKLEQTCETLLARVAELEKKMEPKVSVDQSNLFAAVPQAVIGDMAMYLASNRGQHVGIMFEKSHGFLITPESITAEHGYCSPLDVTKYILIGLQKRNITKMEFKNAIKQIGLLSFLTKFNAHLE